MTNDGTDKDGLSVMVDLVMLARLILEEQQLDDGRNSGRGGKYGGKYHPQQQQQQRQQLPLEADPSQWARLPPTG